MSSFLFIVLSGFCGFAFISMQAPMLRHNTVVIAAVVGGVIGCTIGAVILTFSHLLLTGSIA